MRKIKYMLGTVTASLALVLGLAVPASAQSVGEQGPGDLANTVSVDLGPCTGILTTTVVQTQANTAVNGQANLGAGTGTGANVGDGTGVGAGTVDQANTSDVSATGKQAAVVTFTPNCSTSNVTNVTNHHHHHAAAQASKAKVGVHGAGHVKARAAGFGQVSRTPAGAVHAGAGGAASTNFAAIAGVVGSLSTAGLGLALRSRLQ